MKILAGGIVIVMALALVACGAKARGPDSASDPPSIAVATQDSAPNPSAPLTGSAPSAGGDTGKPGKPAGDDGVPAKGAETFTAAAGGTSVVGAGAKLVKYRVEMENGIVWGSNPVWTPVAFAAVVDKAIAAPLGWTRSAQAPITDPADKLNKASWSFQRVSSTGYDVRIRLATPGTVDKLCAAVGVPTEGIFSCRIGQTILVNLRRWLRGIDGFPANIAFHDMTVNHELGHFLGFNHMKCPGPGMTAPIMQTQTVALDGCVPSAYPFSSAGAFVVGPWEQS